MILSLTKTRYQIRAFLVNQPQVERTGRASFTVDGRPVDFGPATSLPEPATGINAILGALIGWLGSQSLALKLLDQLGKRKVEKLRQALKA